MTTATKAKRNNSDKQTNTNKLSVTDFKEEEYV